MTRTCDCGQEIEAKNSAGHYRDQCAACIRTVADNDTSHVETCDQKECPVCEDHREEFG